MAKKYSIAWIYHILFIHSSVYGHLCCLHLLPIMNNAALNICVQVSDLTYVFISLGHILRSGIIAASYCNPIFNHLKTCQTIFQSGCIILYSHWQCISVLIFPCPRQNLLLFDFLILAILVGVKWCLLVALICVSLITNAVNFFPEA